MRFKQNYKATIVDIKKSKDRAVVLIEIEGKALPEKYCPSYNLANTGGKNLYEQDKSFLEKDKEISVYFTKSYSTNGVKMINGHIDTSAEFFEDEEEDEAVSF